MISAAITAGVGIFVSAKAMDRIFTAKENNNDGKLLWTEIVKVGVGSALAYTALDAFSPPGR